MADAPYGYDPLYLRGVPPVPPPPNLRRRTITSVVPTPGKTLPSTTTVPKRDERRTHCDAAATFLFGGSKKATASSGVAPRSAQKVAQKAPAVSGLQAPKRFSVPQVNLRAQVGDVKKTVMVSEENCSLESLCSCATPSDKPYSVVAKPATSDIISNSDTTTQSAAACPAKPPRASNRLMPAADVGMKKENEVNSAASSRFLSSFSTKRYVPPGITFSPQNVVGLLLSKNATEKMITPNSPTTARKGLPPPPASDLATLHCFTSSDASSSASKSASSDDITNFSDTSQRSASLQKLSDTASDQDVPIHRAFFKDAQGKASFVSRSYSSESNSTASATFGSASSSSEVFSDGGLENKADSRAAATTTGENRNQWNNRTRSNEFFIGIDTKHDQRSPWPTPDCSTKRSSSRTNKLSSVSNTHHELFRDPFNTFDVAPEERFTKIPYRVPSFTTSFDSFSQSCDQHERPAARESAEFNLLKKRTQRRNASRHNDGVTNPIDTPISTLSDVPFHQLLSRASKLHNNLKKASQQRYARIAKNVKYFSSTSPAIHSEGSHCISELIQQCRQSSTRVVRKPPVKLSSLPHIASISPDNLKRHLKELNWMDIYS